MYYWLVQKYLWTPIECYKERNSTREKKNTQHRTCLNCIPYSFFFHGQIRSQCGCWSDWCVCLCVALVVGLFLKLSLRFAPFWWGQRQHLYKSMAKMCSNEHLFIVCNCFFMSCPSCDDADYWKQQLFFLLVPCLRRSVHKQGVRNGRTFIVFRWFVSLSISIDVVTLQIFGFAVHLSRSFSCSVHLLRMVFCLHSNALFLFSTSLLFFCVCITKKCVKMFDNLNNGPDYHRWWLCDLIGDSVSKPLF